MLEPLRYREWAEDLDITVLAGDIDERRRLLDNVAASLHIHFLRAPQLAVNVAP